MTPELRKTIVDSLINGAECGIHYWARYEWVGGTYEDFEREGSATALRITEMNDDGTHGKVMDITPELAWDQLRVMLTSNSNQNLRRFAADILAEDGDADSDDALIQFCLFQEIVYG